MACKKKQNGGAVADKKKAPKMRQGGGIGPKLKPKPKKK